MLKVGPSLSAWKLLYAFQWILIGSLTLKVALGPGGGHYGIFSTAGSYLMQVKNPYGVDWGFGGLWFYSPVCGWFFGLLSFLPKSIGVCLFNLLSHVLFLEGLRRFLKYFEPPKKPNLFLSLLILLGTGELIGAYQHIRPEMIMVGMVLIAFDISFRNPFWAALVASLAINIKWFPLAPVGLFCLVHLKERRFRFPFYVGLTLLLWFGLPFLVYGSDFASALYRDQDRTLSEYVNSVYLDFYSVFGFFKHSFGIILSKLVVSTLMGLVALLLAATVWLRCQSRQAGLIGATVLGTFYVVNFNLLSQSSAFCIATPALAYLISIACNSNSKERALNWFMIGLYWFLVSMCFSDLVPHSFRDLCREMRIKPLGSLILLIFFLVRAWGIPQSKTEQSLLAETPASV